MLGVFFCTKKILEKIIWLSMRQSQDDAIYIKCKAVQDTFMSSVDIY